MDSNRQARIESVYQSALDAPASERASLVKRECAGDDDLCRQVLALLAHYDAAVAEFGVDEQPQLPETINGFRIIEILGEGGMGTVYLAEQSEPMKRLVALKVAKSGDGSREILARFQVERQALAVMDHPGIARVFEAGATPEGHPFFAMEYVPGSSITQFCDEGRLTMGERIALFVEVCNAIQYAHHKGVIHRDIKPQNVIVTTQNGKPVPKVIDFGIAKAIDANAAMAANFTRNGMLVGTPEYMSPEQAAMGDVDARADVYALGLLLYELLVGATPLDRDSLRQKGLDAMMQAIRDLDPPRPSTRAESLGEEASAAASTRRTEPRSLVRMLRGDLDWIAMKALENDRERRYSSPAEFAADLQRYQRNEPVIARPPSAVYRFRKFTRRHRLGVGVAAAASFGVLAVAVVTTVQSRRVATERDRANREAQVSRDVSGYLSDLFHDVTLQHGRTGDITLIDVLDQGVENLDSEDYQDLSVDAKVELLRVLGDAHSNVGRLDAGIESARRSVGLAEERFGDDHIETAESRYHLAAMLYQQGRAEEAVTIGEAVLPVFERELGAGHRLTQRCLRYLGVACTGAGRDRDAVAYFQKLLPSYEQSFGPDHPRVAMLLREIATAQVNSGDYAVAVGTARQSLDLLETRYGADHAYSTLSLKTLASALRFSGQLNEALDVEDREIAALRNAYGDSFAGLMGAYDLRGWILSDMGRADDAREAFTRALSYESQNEAKHAVNPLRGLGTIEYRAGRHDAARQLIDRALTIARNLENPTQFRTAALMTDLAVIELDDGNVQTADSLITAAMASFAELMTTDHVDVANARYAMGRCLVEKGDLAAAESQLRAARSSYASRYPENDYRVRQVDRSLATVHALQEKTSPPHQD